MLPESDESMCTICAENWAILCRKRVGVRLLDKMCFEFEARADLVVYRWKLDDSSQYGAFSSSNKSSFDETHASTLDCSNGSSYGSTLKYYDRSAFNSSFSSTLNASFSSTLNMSVENSIIVRDGELHGVHHCSDTTVENQAKIDREAQRFTAAPRGYRN